MNTKKIVQLLTILSFFSTLSFIISNFTYKNLNTRAQTIYSIEPDFFILKDEIPFNFRQELFTTVSNVRFSELADDQNELNYCKNIQKKNGYRPIAIDSEYDKFSIELIGKRAEVNEKCIENILKSVTKKFHANVVKKIDIIKSNKLFLLEILNRSNRINIDEENFILISVSELLNSIEKNEINKITIGNNYSTAVDQKEKKYLTFINEEMKKIIIEKSISREITFSIVSPSNTVTDNYKIEIERTLLKDDLAVKKLENLLNNIPYKISSINSSYVKISKTKYILSVLILMNIIGLIIFFLLNRILIINLLKKFN